MNITNNQTSFGSIPGPEDITRVELPNGIVVLARASFNSPSVMVNGYLPVGGLFDSDEKLGLADFISAGLMRGTEKRDFQKIYDDLESVGASLGYSGGTHSTGFSGKSLVEDLDLLLGLLTETLRQPTFPEDQIERLRAQFLTGLELRSQSTSAMASLTFDEMVYAGHPYSRPEEGNPETIMAITLKDLKSFHQLHYGPRGMVIAIVGGIDPQEAVDQISSKLGDWQNLKQPQPPTLPEWKPLLKGVSKRVKIPGKSQSDIVIGTAGPLRSSPDYMAASLGNNILGRFGMMGRIGDVVRVKSGLAYYAYSSLNGGLGPGPWTAEAGVNPKNEGKVIKLIKKEIKRFVSELVTEEELSDSKSNYIGRLPLSLESNAGVSGAMLVLERYQLGLDYYQRYPEVVNVVSASDIMEAAATYLDPERLGISVAGPPKTRA